LEHKSYFIFTGKHRNRKISHAKESLCQIICKFLAFNYYIIREINHQNLFNMTFQLLVTYTYYF